MSLPPLPRNTALEQACGFDALHYHEAIAYGQACREAALEEAATLLETGELRGTEQDIHKISALLIRIAKYIRSMK